MAENTSIEWCDSTFNPWIGCQRVSPGCVHCYAETRDNRFTGGANWGPSGTRTVTSDSNWRKPLAWDRKAADEGRRYRVFCASLADVFEDRPDLVAPRARLFALIQATPNLDWLLLTKRPENMVRLAADLGWDGAWPANVWAGCTVEDQRRADERIPHLLRVPAAVRFLSCEPLLGPLDLRDALGLTWEKCGSCGLRYPDVYWAEDTQWARVVGDTFGGLRCPACFTAEASRLGLVAELAVLKPPLRRIDWVIAGGESGHGARPMHPDWARWLRDQCDAAGVPFLFKQWGEYAPLPNDAYPDKRVTGDARDVHVLANGSSMAAGAFRLSDGEVYMRRVGKHDAGRLLDGRTHDEWPASPAARERAA